MEPALLRELERWEQQSKKRDTCFDESRKITLANVHPHELIFNNGLNNNRCDICSKRNLTEGYRCKEKQPMFGLLH